MFGLFEAENPDDYDLKRLRRDLADEFGCQGAAFSGGLGFMDMMEAETASPKKLIKMAKQEGFDLKKYRK
ncbi:MAG: hypothetical protein K5988_10400 [Lachnospiraceae bacterium]|nr:hypothetical protein [Lachnospiraceae bacterium]